jgi:tRNA nucleotidyltransferase (CCA-adding enzyme)
MEERVVAVIRSRDAAIDAGAVARPLGGGGHRQAAAATFHGPLAEARRIALDALLVAVPEGPTAGQVMSGPARFVGPDDTVAHAMALCQRHRQSGIQVGQPEALLGVVSRRT